MSDVRFGRFRLDMAQRQLTREGAVVPLGGRALDVLCALVSAKGDIVSKDELMAQVWPGLVVEENNIQVHISALRKALDDGTSGQSHVVTVTGRGYRFVGIDPSAVGSSLAGGPHRARHSVPWPGGRFRFFGIDPSAVGSSLAAEPQHPLLPDKPSIAILPF